MENRLLGDKGWSQGLQGRLLGWSRLTLGLVGDPSPPILLSLPRPRLASESTDVPATPSLGSFTPPCLLTPVLLFVYLYWHLVATECIRIYSRSSTPSGSSGVTVVSEWHPHTTSREEPSLERPSPAHYIRSQHVFLFVFHSTSPWSLYYISLAEQ